MEAAEFVIREVGAMLINVGWEQTFATNRRPAADDPDVRAVTGS
jgi:hypothetical protein